MSGGIRTPGAERLHEPGVLPAEEELDRSLRPKRLEDFVGQGAVKEQLDVFIQAARGRGEALDHVLLAARPGSARPRWRRSSPTSSRWTSSLPRARPGAQGRRGLVHHRARAALGVLRRRDPPPPRALEETFYPAMEDHRLPITVGQGAGARVVTLDLPPFTLVGATTRTGLLTTPLRDRFGVTHRLELYTAEELGQIVRRSAGILEVEVDDAGAEVIASRARGTPRWPTGCSSGCATSPRCAAQGDIDAQVAREALDLLEIDERGPRPPRPRHPRRHLREVRRGPAGSRPWRRRWARRPTRSRTSTSPTFSSAAS